MQEKTFGMAGLEELESGSSRPRSGHPRHPISATGDRHSIANVEETGGVLCGKGLLMPAPHTGK